MAHYVDGTQLTDFGEGKFKATGWLSRQHLYPQAHLALEVQPSQEVFEKLCQLCINPWQPTGVGELHACDFCKFSGGTGVASYNGYAITGTSAKLLFIPGKSVVYVAPVTILHYIDAHGYAPPSDFCTAVLRCPAMRSSAYFQALLDNGGRELVRHPHH